MKPDIGPHDRDEPAVTNPRLEELVVHARNQPVARLEVDADRIHEAWLERRNSRRWTMGAVAAAALAGLFFLTVYRPGSDAAVVPNEESTAQRAAVPDQAAGAAVEPEPEPSPRVIALADGVSVEPRSAGTPAARVLGGHEVALFRGSYEVTVSATVTRPLRIALPTGTLELEEGVLLIVLTGPEPEVTLSSGRAAWIHEDGGRTVLPPPTAEAPTASQRPDANTLARRADAQLSKGDRDGAIRTLTRIIERYKRSPAARAAALDLAQLLRRAGRIDRARCAYRVYLDRWPYAQLRGDIEKALKQLGPGPDCRGLEPSK